MSSHDSKKQMFGNQPYDSKQSAEITERLQSKINPEELVYRPGPGGKMIHYLKADTVFDRLNNVFGPVGWSQTNAISQIKEETLGPRLYKCRVTVTTTITYQNGAFQQSHGVGIMTATSQDEAYKNALKAAETDGLKRAARHVTEVGSAMAKIQEEPSRNKRQSPTDVKEAPVKRIKVDPPLPKPKPISAAAAAAPTGSSVIPKLNPDQSIPPLEPDLDKDLLSFLETMERGAPSLLSDQQTSRPPPISTVAAKPHLYGSTGRLLSLRSFVKK